MTPSNQEALLDLKSKVFNELGVFQLEESSRTPNGVQFWNNLKKAIDIYIAELEKTKGTKDE